MLLVHNTFINLSQKYRKNIYFQLYCLNVFHYLSFYYFQNNYLPPLPTSPSIVFEEKTNKRMLLSWVLLWAILPTPERLSKETLWKLPSASVVHELAISAFSGSRSEK